MEHVPPEHRLEPELRRAVTRSRRGSARTSSPAYGIRGPPRQRIARPEQRRQPMYAGIVTRAAALAVERSPALSIFAVGSAVVA